jgi:transketolase
VRKAFVSTLVELAEADPRIVLLTADLGFMALEPFADRFPDRFVNVGVAEQNMIGIATGLAEAGFIPFAYSIVAFASLRPYEFIRNGPIQHRLPVRIVGIGGGVGYGQNGLSHYGLEDIGVMRVQPGIRVIAPADHRQVPACLRSTWDDDLPIYYRLEKDDATIVPGLQGRFETGKVQVVREGSDCMILSMGTIAAEVSEGIDQLEAHNISCGHAVIADINPPPHEHLRAILQHHRLVITVEAHYASGGIGSLVAETIATAGLDCRLVRLGFETTPGGRAGSQSSLLSRNRLNRRDVEATVVQELKSAAVR